MDVVASLLWRLVVLPVIVKFVVFILSMVLVVANRLQTFSCFLWVFFYFFFLVSRFMEHFV